jgi:hypothetical protein
MKMTNTSTCSRTFRSNGETEPNSTPGTIARNTYSCSSTGFASAGADTPASERIGAEGTNLNDIEKRDAYDNGRLCG